MASGSAGTDSIQSHRKRYHSRHFERPWERAQETAADGSSGARANAFPPVPGFASTGIFPQNWNLTRTRDRERRTATCSPSLEGRPRPFALLNTLPPAHRSWDLDPALSGRPLPRASFVRLLESIPVADTNRSSNGSSPEAPRAWTSLYGCRRLARAPRVAGGSNPSTVTALYGAERAGWHAHPVGRARGSWFV